MCLFLLTSVEMLVYLYMIGKIAAVFFFFGIIIVEYVISCTGPQMHPKIGNHKVRELFLLRFGVLSPRYVHVFLAFTWEQLVQPTRTK